MSEDKTAEARIKVALGQLKQEPGSDTRGTPTAGKGLETRTVPVLTQQLRASQTPTPPTTEGNPFTSQNVAEARTTETVLQQLRQQAGESSSVTPSTEKTQISTPSSPESVASKPKTAEQLLSETVLKQARESIAKIDANKPKIPPTPETSSVPLTSEAVPIEPGINVTAELQNKQPEAIPVTPTPEDKQT